MADLASILQGIDPATLVALLEAANANATTVPANATTPTATTLTGESFRSLGFVAVGNGTDPGEGTVIAVPTKGGKLKSVRTVQRIDGAPFGITGFSWCYTYTNVKRGETK